jgi:hypothetical protein
MDHGQTDRQMEKEVPRHIPVLAADNTGEMHKTIPMNRK